MMRYPKIAAALALVCASSAGALAQEKSPPIGQKVAIGGRAGQEITVTEASGIGSANATLSGVVSEESAVDYCYPDENPKSACVKEYIAEVGTFSVAADCTAGMLINHDGGGYYYVGPAKDLAAELNTAPDQIYVDAVSNEFVNGSSASGYPAIDAQFQALCPAIFLPGGKLPRSNAKPDPALAQANISPGNLLRLRRMVVGQCNAVARPQSAALPEPMSGDFDTIVSIYKDAGPTGPSQAEIKKLSRSTEENLYGRIFAKTPSMNPRIGQYVLSYPVQYPAKLIDLTFLYTAMVYCRVDNGRIVGAAPVEISNVQLPAARRNSR